MGVHIRFARDCNLRQGFRLRQGYGGHVRLRQGGHVGRQAVARAGFLPRLNSITLRFTVLRQELVNPFHGMRHRYPKEKAPYIFVIKVINQRAGQGVAGLANARID